MPQCQGTTKAGQRCKRDVNEGSEFCGFHGEQAAADASSGDASSSDASSGDTGDRSTDLLLIGVVAVGLFALKRLLRFL